MIGLLALAAAVATQPQPKPQVAATIDIRHRLVEGIATDGRTIWASSVLDRAILACREGRCRPIATLPKGAHPLGIAWDHGRRRLWVTADCPPIPGVEKCEQGEVFALDRAGRVRARLSPRLGAAFHPGDVSASPQGVFVSDSLSGAVYRVSRRGRALTALLAPNIGRSAQGSTVDAPSRRLIVADYGGGIAALDLKTGARTLFPRADGTALRGFDGLMRCGPDHYLATFNAQAPNRLVAVTLKEERAETRDIVTGGDLEEPTQLATDGKRLLLIANSGWQAAEKPDVPRKDSVRILFYLLRDVCSG